MPVNSLSRYASMPVIEAEDAEGESKRCLPLRRSISSQTRIIKNRVYGAHETVDLIAKTEFSHEFLYWSLLEANNLSFPDDLDVGEIVLVPSLGDITRVSRK